MNEHLFSRRGAIRGRSVTARSARVRALRLRRGALGDLQALQALENTVFSGDRMSLRQFRHHLSAPSSDLIVAVAGDVLLGYALLFRRRGSNIGRVYSIAVAAAARGQGLGARLLERLEAIARSHALGEIRLEVRTDNAAALTLYERRGYRRFAVRSVYYEDGCDAQRLSKPLARKRRRRS